MEPSGGTRDPGRLAIGSITVLAWSADEQGVVNSVDAGGRTAVLADGTELRLLPRPPLISLSRAGE